MRERPILFSAPMVRAILEGRKTQTRRVVSRLAGFGMVTDFGPSTTPGYDWHCRDGAGRFHDQLHGTILARCPYGEKRDRLWVRESWQDVHPLQVADGRYSQEGRAGIPGPPGVTYRTVYRADGAYPRIHFDDQNGEHVADWPYRAVCPGDGCTLRHVHPEEDFTGWRPSIHMPRWASRITLEVTGVRVERLRNISEADAIAEGIHVVQIGSGYPDRYSPNPVAWADVIEQQAEAYEDPCVAYQDLWESINGDGTWLANPYVWVVEFRRVEQDTKTA